MTVPASKRAKVNYAEFEALAKSIVGASWGWRRRLARKLRVTNDTVYGWTSKSDRVTERTLQHMRALRTILALRSRVAELEVENRMLRVELSHKEDRTDD